MRSINSRLILIILSVLLVYILSVFIFINNRQKEIIDRSKAEVYFEKIEFMLAEIDETYRSLQDASTHEAHAKEFRGNILNQIRRVYYQNKDKRANPFIIDGEGTVLLHPTLKRGDKSLVEREEFKEAIRLKTGEIDYGEGKESGWLIFKHFGPYNWVVGYDVPLNLKYADEMQLRNRFLAVTLIVFLLAVIFAALMARRFTRPILRLTAAAREIQAGALNRRVEISTRDEIGELASAFNDMTSKLQSLLEGLQREVTARARTQKELAESEKKYRTLFEDSIEGMILTYEGEIIDVNPAWLKMLGYSNKEEVLGRDIIDFVHQDDHGMLLERRKKWKNNIDRTFQVRGLRRDGALIDSEVHSCEIVIEGKTLMLSTTRDITDLKRSEKEKEDLQVRLQRAEKMEAIGTMAGGVAHDLNNILSGIVGYPDLLLTQVPDESPLKKPLLTILDTGKKAAAIVQDLLTLARRGVSRLEVVDINRVITAYLESPEFGRLKSFHRDVDVETDLCDNLLNIMGSTVHLSKTVMNLVSNAAEAMPDKGEITIKTSQRYIDRPVKGYDEIAEGDYVVLAISDTGIGISPGDLDKIFEPFYTKKEMGVSGSGLGMAVVWSTVKDHNGYIDVQSDMGKGTTFTLYFPATREKQGKGRSEFLIEKYRGKGESVLVVDDSEEQREIASHILSQLGYSVQTVSNGLEAVEYVRNNRPDLLILDMIMDPGIDGLETFRRIRKIRPSQRAIITSGFTETERVLEARRMGAGQYIPKPYTIENIGIAVRAELDRK